MGNILLWKDYLVETRILYTYLGSNSVMRVEGIAGVPQIYYFDTKSDALEFMIVESYELLKQGYGIVDDC